MGYPPLVNRYKVNSIIHKSIIQNIILCNKKRRCLIELLVSCYLCKWSKTISLQCKSVISAKATVAQYGWSWCSTILGKKCLQKFFNSLAILKRFRQDLLGEVEDAGRQQAPLHSPRRKGGQKHEVMGEYRNLDQWTFSGWPFWWMGHPLLGWSPRTLPFRLSSRWNAPWNFCTGWFFSLVPPKKLVWKT